MQIENEEEVARYYKLKMNLDLIQDQMATMMSEPKYLLPFLQPGRLITVSAPRCCARV
jgi:ATP-dependent RNA helicase DOB1